MMKKYLTFDEASLVKLKIVSIRNINDDDLKEKLIGRQYNILNDNINIDEVMIGRSRKSNDIVIKDLSISTNHAKICFSKGRFYVIDLNSKHGTFINDKKLLIEQHHIHVGTEIRFGRIICHVIEIKDVNDITASTKVVKVEPSIQNMNYYENLLKEEHAYNLYNDQIITERKRRRKNDERYNNDDRQYNINSMKTTNTRIQEFSERTRIKPLIVSEPIVTHDSIYTIGASIFRSLGGDPMKKLGKNQKEEEKANEPLSVTRRAKNLGLGAIGKKTRNLYKKCL